MDRCRILLVPNPERDRDLQVTAQAASILSACGADLFSTEFLPGVTVVSPEKGAETADFAIVFGGDGTILRFSRAAAPHSLPILGVNLGTLGYMAELQASEVSSVARLLSGDFRTEARMMLLASVVRGGQVRCRFDCLNDAVVSYCDFPHLISFELSDSDVPFACYSADGMIFATPTGSTAYSLSAGGPIMDPLLSAIVATPICPHSLTGRPMVFSSDAALSLKIGEQRRGTICLTADGDRSFPLQAGDRIEIRRSDLSATLIRFRKDPFGKILASKFY